MSSKLAELERDVATPPVGWRTAQFSTLADYVNGRAFKPEDWGTVGLPIIRIAQITNPDAEANFYDGEVDPRNLIDTDDLIFSWSATLAVMRWKKGPAVLNQHLFKVTPAKNIDRDWLQFRLEASIPDLADEAHGTTMKHIRKGTLSSKTTLVPPLDEQRRIAEVLRSVDEAIAAAERAVAQAEHSLKLNAEKLLVHDLAGEATECRLVDVIASLDAGVSVNSEGRPAADGEIGILKTSCVSAGHFDPGENKVVRQDEVNRTRVQPTANSIIISRMNTLDLVGANAFVGVDCPNLYLPDRLWLLKTKPSVVCRWLAFYMKTTRFRAQIVDIASGTSGSMKNISKGRLADLVLHVPPYRQQERDVEALVAMETSILSSMAIVRSYREVRQAIMSDLLTGRVRVSA